MTDSIKRKYVKEGMCLLFSDTTKKASKDKVAVFAFNDILVIATLLKNGK